MTLGPARLDMGVLLQKQDILLQNVPQGAARVMFNNTDFGSLLGHPLLLQLASRAVQVSLATRRSLCGACSCACHVAGIGLTCR